MAERLVAFYGDDLTGSVDVLLQFSRSGWSGRLFVGLPDAPELARAAREVDVVGIAGLARSLPTGALAAEVGPALRALGALDPAVVQYKACSTADSSPELGSIGRVLELAREAFGPRGIPMLFAQPDFGRYTVFGHHFAAEDGTVYRLDRQPTMSTHPATPMTEAQLTRHFAEQTDLPLESVPFTALGDAAAVAARLRDSPAAGVVLDALSESDLDRIGAALWTLADESRPLVAIGSGGLSAALARSAARPGPAGADAKDTDPRSGGAGPVLVVSGSRSPRTVEQIDAARASGWAVLPLVGAAAAVEDAIGLLQEGRSVVLTAHDQQVPASGGEDAVVVIGTAAADAVTRALEAGATRRVIVCGGDTSGRVMSELGVTSVRIAANPVGNVVLCVAESAQPRLDGLELVLKGGQVGPADLFELVRALP